VRLRALAPALLLVMAAGVAACGGDGAEDEADGGPLVVSEPQNEAMTDASDHCDAFRPLGNPDATVTLVQPTTVDGVRRAAEAFATAVPAGLEGLDPGASIARCSYTPLTVPTDPAGAPTTVCPDGEVFQLRAPQQLQYLVLEDGTGIEDTPAAPVAAPVPC
jgi:hypothetical protein